MAHRVSARFTKALLSLNPSKTVTVSQRFNGLTTCLIRPSLQCQTQRRSFTRSVRHSSSMTYYMAVPHAEDTEDSIDVGYRDISIMPDGVEIPFRRNDLQFYNDEGREPVKPHFTFLLENSNLKGLTPAAIRRGSPKDNHDIWIVNHDWSDTTDSLLPDSCSVVLSERYHVHLSQVLYASNSMKMEYGNPTVSEQLDPSKIPCATFSDESIDESIQTANLWMDCMKIQKAILHDWRKARGRAALQVLLEKANQVCMGAAYEAYGVTTIKQLVEVDNIGGSSYYDNGCVIDYAVLTPNERGSIDNVLKAEKMWRGKDYFQRQYTPDFQLCASTCKSSSLSYITGDVKSSNTSEAEIQTAWNQALIGLKDRKTTYAIAVSPKEAMILKIEVNGDTVNTSKRKYPLISRSSGSPNLKNFFRDLVLIVWEGAYNR